MSAIGKIKRARREWAEGTLRLVREAELKFYLTQGEAAIALNGDEWSWWTEAHTALCELGDRLGKRLDEEADDE